MTGISGENSDSSHHGNGCCRRCNCNRNCNCNSNCNSNKDCGIIPGCIKYKQSQLVISLITREGPWDFPCHSPVDIPPEIPIPPEIIPYIIYLTSSPLVADIKYSQWSLGVHPKGSLPDTKTSILVSHEMVMRLLGMSHIKHVLDKFEGSSA